MKFKITDLIKGTVLSVLVFFSISYLFVLYRISPITFGDTYTLKIGFPFKYYEQFQLRGNSAVNSSWYGDNLLLDSFITWGIVCGLYIIKKKTASKYRK